MTTSPGRVRADRLLVERGLFESRTAARQAIEAGLVAADARPVARPSEMIRSDADLSTGRLHPWVSRGGVKLAAALDAFGVQVAGLDCLDVGACTGGFTDVLLRRGAARVHAVDVGRGQLHPRLLADPRVLSLEATDARRLRGRVEPRSIDVVTVDVSFISLRLVIPELLFALRPGARLVALVKPQFEVGPEGIGRGGIVRDGALRAQSVERIQALLASLGFAVLGPIPSPIAGRDGNLEFLIGGVLA